MSYENRDEVIGARSIMTQVPLVDFCKGMRGATSEKSLAADTNLMFDAPLKLFNGQQMEDGGRGSYNGHSSKVSLNLGRLTNMSPALLDMIGTTQQEKCERTGNTPAGTPVTVKKVTNVTKQKEPERNVVQITMDLPAIAEVNDIESGRDAKVAAGQMSKYKLGKTPIQLEEKTTTQGVAASNEARIAANLGEMAAQNYLMTTSPKTADSKMVQKDDVASVAGLYAKEFKAFVTKYADKDCKGIPAMVGEKGADGKVTYSKGKDMIEGTGFKSLKAMGFKPQELEDGSMAIVCIDSSKEACDTRKENLRNFNNAFNKHMSQVAGQTFESGSVARNLAAGFSMECYPTTSPGSDVTLMQPSSKFKVDSYANSVIKAAAVYTHSYNDLQTGQEITPERAYGEKILQNTATIRDYYPDKGGSEGKDRVLDEIRAKVPEATKAFDARELGD